MYCKSIVRTPLAFILPVCRAAIPQRTPVSCGEVNNANNKRKNPCDSTWTSSSLFATGKGERASSCSAKGRLYAGIAISKFTIVQAYKNVQSQKTRPCCKRYGYKLRTAFSISSASAAISISTGAAAASCPPAEPEPVSEPDPTDVASSVDKNEEQLSLVDTNDSIYARISKGSALHSPPPPPALPVAVLRLGRRLRLRVEKLGG